MGFDERKVIINTEANPELSKTLMAAKKRRAIEKIEKCENFQLLALTENKMTGEVAIDGKNVMAFIQCIGDTKRLLLKTTLDLVLEGIKERGSNE